MNNNHSLLLKKHEDILSFRDLADSTVSTYISYMTSFILWVEEQLPGRDISSVTWEEMRSYVIFLKNVRNLNPRTINVHLAQLRDFYYYVLHRDWDKREVPFLHFDERLPIVPDQKLVRLIIGSITNLKHRAEIALLYSSGIRVSELCRLHCGDIHMSAKRIHIEKGKNRSERYAVLSERILPELVTYVKEFYPHATKEDWLFPNRAGDHISTEAVRCVFSQTLRKLNLSEKGYTLHSLRHAFGLHLYEAGEDLMSIKEAMGHKALSSTTVYLTLGVGNGRSVTSPYDFK